MSLARPLAAALCLGALSTLFAGAAQAAPDACPDDADIVRALYPGVQAPDARGRVHVPGTDAVILVANVAAGDPFGLTCKAWPANPDLLLVAVPLMRDQSEAEAADGHEGDLDVLVLERATLKPLRQRRLKGLMMDDAVALTSLTFDTARYDLMPDRRAFGIRISRAAGSRVSLYGESSLRLFVMGERELEMVLDGMVVSGTRGDWDTRCAGDVEERKVTVGLGSGSSQGYRDLSLTEARERRLFETQGDDCGERTVGKDRIRHTLRFEGKGYVIPEALRSMDRAFVEGSGQP